MDPLFMPGVPYDQWFEKIFNDPYDLQWFSDNHFSGGYPYNSWSGDPIKLGLRTEPPKDVEWISDLPNPGIP